MTCAVVGCNNSKRTKGLSFYEIPKINYKEGCTVLDLTRKRRRLWLKAINRDDISMESLKYCHKVCAHHFISGRPAYYRMELDPDWIPNKNLPSHSQIENNSTSTDPHHRQRTKRKSKDSSARGQANKKRQIGGAVSQSTQDHNDAESEKEQDIHLTHAKDEEELTPKLEELTYIKKESLLCEYPKCAEVKKELFKDLQNALLVEKQLRAMIKYLESISNVNLDLLQVCLDMHRDPAVEAEFKKVIDMVQTIMNLEMWDLKAQRRDKHTICDPPLKTTASISRKSTSSTCVDLRDHTDDINHCNDNNADNHSPSSEITHLKNNLTFMSQINSDAATERNDNTTSISNAETFSNINANTITHLKDANTTTEMSEWINEKNANTSSPSHVSISSPAIKTRISTINADDITSLTMTNYPKQQGLSKDLKIFLVSPSGPKNNITHTLISKSSSTIPTLARSEGANSNPNLSGVPNYDGCIGICNKFVNFAPPSASCPTQICGRTRVLCETCGKLIACSKSSAEAFKLHMKRVHSGERPHKCEQCGKRFVCKRHLTYHLHLHSGERSYQCEDCGKSFKSKSNLQQHQMIHKKDAKMHECSLCDYKCIWPGNLKMHMNKRHGISVSSDSINAIPLEAETGSIR